MKQTKKVKYDGVTWELVKYPDGKIYVINDWEGHIPSIPFQQLWDRGA